MRKVLFDKINGQIVNLFDTLAYFGLFRIPISSSPIASHKGRKFPMANNKGIKLNHTQIELESANMRKQCHSIPFRLTHSFLYP